MMGAHPKPGFFLNRMNGFEVSIERVPEKPSLMGFDNFGDIYQTRELALMAWINELELVKDELMAAIAKAKKKQRRWDQKRERRDS